MRSQQRDELPQHLEKRGIHALIHYAVPPHLQEAYREPNMRRGNLLICEAIHDEVIGLPAGRDTGLFQVVKDDLAIRELFQ